MPLPETVLVRFISSNKINKAEGEEMALGTLESGGDIREGEQEADDIVAVQNDLDQAMVGDQEDIVHCVLHVAGRERIVFPVMNEGAVVGLADTRSPLQQLALALEMLDLEVGAFRGPVGDALDALGHAE